VTPKGHAQEIVATLEGIIKRQPDHPGALHLYIHAVEGSSTPERAEAAADRLESLMPEAGHIVHMPSHIYYRVGRYADAVQVNERAAKTDEDYIAACKAQGFYPLAYYAHNIHFLWTSSEMMGRYQASIDAARRVVKAAKDGPAADVPPIQLFLFTPIATYIRFGKWNDALAEPLPAANLKLATVMTLYARGIAFANTNQLDKARDARMQIQAMLDARDFTSIDDFGTPATRMAEIGLALLDGELARVSGQLRGALIFFRKAKRIEETLPYTEPPYWHQPVSHILGAALLEAQLPHEAEIIYRTSLKSYRVDGWALFGLAQALDAQGMTAEADAVRADFRKAWSLADTKLSASRF
jgi:tetratricopeptide (TPR) repeat protein